jgi:hypothetical protein
MKIFLFITYIELRDVVNERNRLSDTFQYLLYPSFP